MNYLTDRKSAEELCDLLKRFEELCGDLAEFSMHLPDEQGAIVRSVFGDASARVYIELLQPVLQSFPDLDPDAEP